MAERILVVDDDALMLQTLQLRLQDEGYDVGLASDGYQAIEECRKNHFHLVICDVKMPGIDGLETLRRIKDLKPELRSIIITGFASEDAPVRAIRLGVDDYLFKPFEDEQFIHCVKQVLGRLKLETENRLLLQQLQEQNSKLTTHVKVLRDQEKRHFDFENIIGRSPAMVGLMKQAQAVARTRSTVLLVGESGTGKEVFARAIHHASPRDRDCFVAINCSAISKDLLESELFGHRRGAFTGAESDRRGLMEEASGGTILLDEIGDMPIDLQAKLLRVLEEGTIRRIGENTERRIDVRVISATNADLSSRVEQGTFREDLFYRLNTITLRIPPLRERLEDLEPLVHYFLARFSAEQGKSFQGIRGETLQYLLGLPWKGNVREVRNVIERAVIFAEDGDWIGLDLMAPGRSAVETAASATGNLNARVEDFERRLIEEALRLSGSKVVQAALHLGISRTNLHNKMAKHKISSH
jgi:DNA-binding NtrC family response regulator